jgi:hypothetical protein
LSYTTTNSNNSNRLNVSTDKSADWPGYRPGEALGDKYGEKLLGLSSPLPESYRTQILELGFKTTRR